MSDPHQGHNNGPPLDEKTAREAIRKVEAMKAVLNSWNYTSVEAHLMYALILLSDKNYQNARITAQDFCRYAKVRKTDTVFRALKDLEHELGVITRHSALGKINTYSVLPDRVVDGVITAFEDVQRGKVLNGKARKAPPPKPRAKPPTESNRQPSNPPHQTGRPNGRGNPTNGGEAVHGPTPPMGAGQHTNPPHQTGVPHETGHPPGRGTGYPTNGGKTHPTNGGALLKEENKRKEGASPAGVGQVDKSTNASPEARHAQQMEMLGLPSQPEGVIAYRHRDGRTWLVPKFWDEYLAKFGGDKNALEAALAEASANILTTDVYQFSRKVVGELGRIQRLYKQNAEREAAKYGNKPKKKITMSNIPRGGW